MNTIVKIIVSAAILIATAASLVGFNMMKTEPRQKENEKQIALVSTYSVSPFSGTLDMGFTGEVVPYRVITKSTEIAGRIKAKSENCRPGRTVEQGDVLIEIDITDYELEIKRLTSEVAQAQAMIDELDDEINGAQQNAEIAQREYDLLQREYERRKEIANSLSQSDLTNAERNAITAQKALISASNNLTILKTRQARMEAALNLSNSLLEKAELDKSRGIITAPIDGVIVASDFEQGDYVTKGAAVFTIEDTARSEILCSLKLEQLDWLWENRPAVTGGTNRTAYQPPKVPVSVSSVVGEQTVSWDGRLDRYNGIGLDDATKSVPCIVVVEQPVVETDLGPVALVRGMFVEVTVEYAYSQPTEESKSQVLNQFPAGAIQPGNYVWLDVDGKLQRREISIVDYVLDEKTGQRMAVVNAAGPHTVAVGEQIVSSPIASPTEGASIRVIRDAIATAAPAQQTDTDKALNADTSNNQ
jgi:multidrug efflux pump subunit AcrA (membrane-fusion protein)